MVKHKQKILWLLIGWALPLAAFFLSPAAEAQSQPFLCSTGNFSNTQQGCVNQGGTAVTDPDIRADCGAPATASARKSCIEGRTPLLLCSTGNFSNTEQGCVNQGGSVVTDPNIRLVCGGTGSTAPERKACIESGGTNTPDAQDAPGTDPLTGDCKGSIETDCAIVGYIRMFVKVLSGLVGVVVVIMITVGGIQFSSARDNPSAVAAAKGRITNAVIALVAYLLLFGFLQWLVPGGIF